TRQGFDLMHLWFLYHLLIFYAFLLIPLQILCRDGALRPVLRKAFEFVMSSRVGPILMGLITAATLLPMRQPGFETSTSLTPPLRILAAYAVFFAFGWFAYKC